MTEPLSPTAYPAVNVALLEFLSSVQTILGPHLRGMYLVGSLAVGDFDPNTSDLDIIVVTDSTLPDDGSRRSATLIRGSAPATRRVRSDWRPSTFRRKTCALLNRPPPVIRRSSGIARSSSSR